MAFVMKVPGCRKVVAYDAAAKARSASACGSAAALSLSACDESDESRTTCFTPAASAASAYEVADDGSEYRKSWETSFSAAARETGSVGSSATARGTSAGSRLATRTSRPAAVRPALTARAILPRPPVTRMVIVLLQTCSDYKI